MNEIAIQESRPINRIYEVFLKKSEESIYISQESKNKIFYMKSDDELTETGLRESIQIHTSNILLKKLKSNAIIHKYVSNLIDNSLFTKIVFNEKSNFSVKFIKDIRDKTLNLKSIDKIIKFSDSANGGLLDDEKIIINIDKINNSPGFITNLCFKKCIDEIFQSNINSTQTSSGELNQYDVKTKEDSNQTIYNKINKKMMKTSTVGAEIFRKKKDDNIIVIPQNSKTSTKSITSEYNKLRYEKNIKRIRNWHAICIKGQLKDFRCINRALVIIYQMLGISIKENQDCIFFSSYKNTNEQNNKMKFLRFSSKRNLEIADKEAYMSSYEKEIKNAFKKLHEDKNKISGFNTEKTNKKGDKGFEKKSTLDTKISNITNFESNRPKEHNRTSRQDRYKKNLEDRDEVKQVFGNISNQGNNVENSSEVVDSSAPSREQIFQSEDQGNNINYIKKSTNEETVLKEFDKDNQDLRNSNFSNGNENDSNNMEKIPGSYASVEIVENKENDDEMVNNKAQNTENKKNTEIKETSSQNINKNNNNHNNIFVNDKPIKNEERNEDKTIDITQDNEVNNNKNLTDTNNNTESVLVIKSEENKLNKVDKDKQTNIRDNKILVGVDPLGNSKQNKDSVIYII